MQFLETPSYNKQIQSLQKPLNYNSILNKQNKNFNQSPYSHFNPIPKPYVLPTARMGIGNLALLGASIPSGGPDFEDDYTTDAGWTEVGGKVLIDNVSFPDICKFNVTDSSGTHHAHKALGLTLSDTLWYGDFDFKHQADAGGTAGFWVFCLAAGTGHPPTATQDSLSFAPNIGGADYGVFVNSKDGTSAVEEGGGISGLTEGTQYFNRFIRSSSTGAQIEVYTDSARTTHESGSPGSSVTIPSTIITLTTLHHTNFLNTSKTLTAELDNTKIFNAVSPS